MKNTTCHSSSIRVVTLYLTTLWDQQEPSGDWQRVRQGATCAVSHVHAAAPVARQPYLPGNEMQPAGQVNVRSLCQTLWDALSGPFFISLTAGCWTPVAEHFLLLLNTCPVDGHHAVRTFRKLRRLWACAEAEADQAEGQEGNSRHYSILIRGLI